MGHVEREYEYLPRGPYIIAVAVCSGLGGIAVNGAIVNTIVKSGLGEVDVSAWVMGHAFYGGYFTLAALCIAQRLCVRQRLVLGAAALTVPSLPFSNQVLAIPYDQIQTVSPYRMFCRDRLLYVHYTRGLCTIDCSKFPSV